MNNYSVAQPLNFLSVFDRNVVEEMIVCKEEIVITRNNSEPVMKIPKYEPKLSQEYSRNFELNESQAKISEALREAALPVIQDNFSSYNGDNCRTNPNVIVEHASDIFHSEVEHSNKIKYENTILVENNSEDMVVSEKLITFQQASCRIVDILNAEDSGIREDYRQEILWAIERMNEEFFKMRGDSYVDSLSLTEHSSASFSECNINSYGEMVEIPSGGNVESDKYKKVSGRRRKQVLPIRKEGESSPASWSAESGISQLLEAANYTSQENSGSESQSSPSPHSLYKSNSKKRRGKPECSNCLTRITTIWRRNQAGELVCNACGLYYKLHQRKRPVDMRRDCIYSRRKKSESAAQPRARHKYERRRRCTYDVFMN